MIKRQNITKAESFNYLRKYLNLANKTLSNYVVKLPIEIDKVYSFVPEETYEDSLYDFSSGGIYPVEKDSLRNRPSLTQIRNDARSIIIQKIYEHINANKNNCCILEDPLATPSDSWVKNSKLE